MHGRIQGLGFTGLRIQDVELSAWRVQGLGFIGLRGSGLCRVQGVGLQVSRPACTCLGI